MNTPHRPGKEPDDRDIAALFDAQPVSVPDELDNAILSAATQAITESSPIPDESKPTIKPLSKTSNRWFALAATVVVGISVAPMLLKSPESSLDAPSTAPVEMAPVEIMAEPVSIIASDDNGGAAGDLLPEVSESLPISHESVAAEVNVEALRARSESEAFSNEQVMKTKQSRTAKTASTTASTALISDSERALKKNGNYDYRNTANAWVKEILRLESAGNVKEASAEYALFRDNHPDFNPEFKPRSLMSESVTGDKP
jgi:hypothetical protein